MAYKRKNPKQVPANNLATERARRFMTQEDLAWKVKEKTGARISLSTISKIECNEVVPRGITKFALAAALEMDVKDLFPLAELVGAA
jgi:DNA-binding XRE family transcriptional regulator